MCHSVHRGVCLRGDQPPREFYIQGIPPSGEGWSELPVTPSIPHQILWDTVNERVVGIVLECILVINLFEFSYWSTQWSPVKLTNHRVIECVNLSFNFESLCWFSVIFWADAVFRCEFAISWADLQFFIGRRDAIVGNEQRISMRRCWDVLVLLICVQILVRLDCFCHSITKEAWKPARWNKVKIHRNEHTPGDSGSRKRKILPKNWKSTLWH